ncbi:MAG: cobyric acid synthase [Theionarchaea archaeon]|nr:cobyric acid synthase [Theionarchaea archaeon]MBU7036507.1 cobyric acid synthase [Theionarchaea archaeon]
MKNRNNVLMVQGTASHAGKSLVTAVILRILSNKGFTVAPFKAQNMSLNSYVTQGGHEVARSQAVQAFAARCELRKEMNPILLKPKGEKTSQIVLLGAPFRDMDVNEYYSSFLKTYGVASVQDSLDVLLSDFDVVVIEGAGSPAEVNLHELEIANMITADMADAPVIIVADIERGGVFASMYGTYQLLKEHHKKRVKGFIINKFRGEESILESGITKIEELTGVPVLGILPYMNHSLPEEDSLGIKDSQPKTVDIAVIRLPRISNFTDFEPLKEEGVRFVETVQEMRDPDAVILPGTKNTVEDLQWLRERGFEDRIKELSSTAVIFGICGGYQMLGTRINDEPHLESGYGSVKGLSLLDAETSFASYEKSVKRVEATILDTPVFSEICGESLKGYEIHMGTTVTKCSPLFMIGGRGEGSAHNNTYGTYLHGIFDNLNIKNAFLTYLRMKKGIKKVKSTKSAKDAWDESIERLAAVFLDHVDFDTLQQIIFGGTRD